MHPFPHRYPVTASAAAQGEVALASPHLPDMPSAPTTEFGGPGGNQEQALRLLAKAEETCLVTNSLKFKPHLDAQVEVDQ